jgi:hypothetical protein
MYRCGACDVPAEFGHRSNCPVEFESSFGSVDMPCVKNPTECCPDDETCCAGEDNRINIASGEDCFV